MQDKFSGAVPLGYAAILILSWILFMPFAGWISFDSFPAVVPAMMILSVVLAVAGIFCLSGNEKIEPVLFLIMGATFFSFALRFVMYPQLEANTAASAIDGWHLLLVAVIVFFLWLSAMKGNSIRSFFLLLLWLALLAGALANWVGLGVFSYISGYLGLIAALLAAWYLLSSLSSSKVADQ